MKEQYNTRLNRIKLLEAYNKSLSESNDDMDWDLYETRDLIEREELLPDLQMMKTTGKKKRQEWNLINFSKLKRVWEYYAKHGFVREEKLIDEFESIIRNNFCKLDLNTEYCGHSTHYPDKYTLEDYGLSVADIDGTNQKMDELTDYYFTDPQSGQLRISDYGLKPLWNLIEKLRKAKKYDEKLVLIDQVLNVVHQRSDLASWFVEGGSRSLSKLSDTEKFDFVNEWKKTSFEEYIKQIKSFYKDQRFVDMVVHSEQSNMRLLGVTPNDIITKITDNGNLLVRYAIKNNNIYILGLTTRDGKINRQDMLELIEFGHEMIDLLNDGLTMITSPNDVSELFIDKMIKNAKSKGIDLIKAKEGSFKFGDIPNIDPKFLNYKMVYVYKK